MELWDQFQPSRRSGRIGIGVDFGTTNSSVALFSGEDLRMLNLDPAVMSSAVLPTALYLNRMFLPRIGNRAIESYLEDNVGRRIEMEKEEVGGFLLSIDTMAGYYEDWVKVHAFTDSNLPSRLFRSIKTWLGDESLDTVKVFDRSLRIVALVTPILAGFRKQLETDGFAGPIVTHFGRPVKYHGSSPNANEVALNRMMEACSHAGFSEPSFLPEPVAASLGYLHRSKTQPGETYLVFDFGGGTLDLCLLKRNSNGFRIIGTKGMELGGDDVDKLVYRKAVFPELGEGALVASRDVGETGKVPFRFGEFAEQLLTWQHTHELNQNELRDLIGHGMRETGSTRMKLWRLLQLISLNLSFRLFQAIEKAKRELTSNQESTIDVPELELQVTITRSDLRNYMKEILGEIESGIEELLESAEFDYGSVDCVICTGGSSRLLPVQGLLEKLFSGRLIEFDPFTGIAGGLAIASYYGYVESTN